MTLIEAIMSREQCSINEAQELLNEIVEECRDMEDASIEDVLFEWGFEPDYIFDILEKL